MYKEEIQKTEAIVQIEKESPTYLECANKISIRTEGDIKPVSDFMVEMKKKINFIEKIKDELVKPMYRIYKKNLDFYNGLKNRVEVPLNIAKEKIAVFQQEEERKRLEEEKRLQEKARIEEEKKRSELLERADSWEEKGNLEKAQILREQASEYFVPTPIVQGVNNTHRSSSGGSITGKSNIEVTVTDKRRLINAVATGVLPLTVVDINMGKLKAFIKATGNRNIQGVSIRDKKDISVRIN